MILSNQQVRKLQQALEAVDPQRLGSFLNCMGWKRGKAWRSIAHDWITPDGDHVLVPRTKQLRDYAQAVRDVIELLESKTRTFDDVLTMISLGAADVIRSHIDVPDAAWGSCSAMLAAVHYNSMFEWLRNSAQSLAAMQRRQKITRVYADGCRAGQTELGSYVMKIYTPVLLQNVADEDKSFGREATMAAVENIQFIADEEADRAAPPPATLRWQVAQAIARMRPEETLWADKCGISVQYTPVTGSLARAALPASDAVSVRIGSTVLDRARRICDDLKRGDEFEQMILDGYIINLHKDRPGTPEPKHQITLDVMHSGRSRLLTMRLIPSEYYKAMAWQKKDYVVRINAKVDKRWKIWTVSQYRWIRPLKPEPEGNTEPSMFPV